MSSNLSITISANTAPLQAGLALGQSALREWTAEQKRLADAVRAAGADVDAVLVGKFQAATAQVSKAKAEVADITTKLKGMHGGLGSTRAAMMEFEHSGRAMADALAAGADPLRVMAMEAPRLVQAFSELNGTAATAILRFGAMAAPIALVAGALGYLVIKANAAREAIDQAGAMNASLGRIGEVASGATASRVQELAAGYNMATADAAKLVTIINSMPEGTLETRRALQDMAAVIGTVTSEEIPKVAEELKHGFSSVSAVESFARENRLLTEGLNDQLQAAKKSNDTFAAQDALLKALQGRYGGLIDQVKDYQQKASLSGRIATIGMMEAGRPDIDTTLPSLPKITGGEGPSDEEQRRIDQQSAKGGAGGAESGWMQSVQGGLTATLEAQRAYGKDAEKVELDYWTTALETAQRGGKELQAAAEEIAGKIYEIHNRQAEEAIEAARRGAEEQKRAAEEVKRQVEAANQAQLRGLEEVTAAAKRGSDERIKDAQAEAAFAAATWGRLSGEAKAAQAHVSEATTEQAEQQKQSLAEWQQDYVAGIREQLADATGNHAAQVALLRDWAAEAKRVYGESSAAFREAMKAEEADAKAAAEKVQEEWKSINDKIGEALFSGGKGGIKKSLQDIFKDAEQSIAKDFANGLLGGIEDALGLNKIDLSGLFKNLFGGSGGSGGGVLGFLGSLIPFADGTDSVPFTGPALVHQGEMIIPAGIASALRGAARAPAASMPTFQNFGGGTGPAGVAAWARGGNTVNGGHTFNQHNNISVGAPADFSGELRRLGRSQLRQIVGKLR